VFLPMGETYHQYLTLSKLIFSPNIFWSIGEEAWYSRFPNCSAQSESLCHLHIAGESLPLDWDEGSPLDIYRLLGSGHHSRQTMKARDHALRVGWSCCLNQEIKPHMGCPLQVQ
jgi:hypothetical protein